VDDFWNTVWFAYPYPTSLPGGTGKRRWPEHWTVQP